jgi:hypothetical protein
MIVCLYIYLIAATSKEVFSIDPSEPDDFLKSILSTRELETVRTQFKAPSVIESTTNTEFPQYIKESEIFEKATHDEIEIDLPKDAKEPNLQLLPITEELVELPDILDLKRAYDKILEENYDLKKQLKVLTETVSTSASLHLSDDNNQESNCLKHLQSFKEDLLSCNIAQKETLLQNDIVDSDTCTNELETDSVTSDSSRRTCKQIAVEDQIDIKCAFDQGIDTIQTDVVGNKEIEFRDNENIAPVQQDLNVEQMIYLDEKEIRKDDEKSPERISSSQHNRYFEYIYSIPILVLIKRIRKFILEKGQTTLSNMQNTLNTTQKLILQFYIHHMQPFQLHLYSNHIKPFAVNVAQYLKFLFSKLFEKFLSPIWNCLVILPYEVYLKRHTTVIGDGIQLFYMNNLESFINTYVEPIIFYLWNKINRVVYNVYRICDRDDIWERSTYSMTIIFSAVFDSLQTIIVWLQTSSLVHKFFGKYTDEVVIFVIYTISAILILQLRKLVLGILATILFVLLSPILLIVFTYSKIRQFLYGKSRKNQKIKSKKLEKLLGKKKHFNDSGVIHAINSNDELHKEIIPNRKEIARVTPDRNEDKLSNQPYSNTSSSSYSNKSYDNNILHDNDKNGDSYQQKDACYGDNA